MVEDNNGKIKAIDLAKYIINTSPSGLSNLELQKTMYFVELDYYKQTGEHLIDDDFEAWQYGPVVRKVYEKYCEYGPDSIENTDKFDIPQNVNKSIIKTTVRRCSNKRSWELVEESHRNDGAWQKTRDKGSKTIDKILIEEEARKYGNT